MNDIIKAIKERRSCRAYKPDAVPAELVNAVCEAGTYAATGMGKQSPVIIAVTNKGVRDALSKMNAQVLGAPEGTDPFYGAPMVIAVLANSAAFTGINDGSLVLGNMMLAASSLGLGSCWIHRAREIFSTDEGKKILADLGIEGDYTGVGFMILGYPEENGIRPAAARKPDYVYHIY
ncbi:MAG: nitroreductase [Lachnospiraceae bacterium]|nr:nitroreductase [Lachnospiraceae bacterium]